MQHFDGSRLRKPIAVTLLVAGILATSSFALTNPKATQGNRPSQGSVAKALVPAPRDVIGFTPGEDRKLASWAQIVDYFKHLERASDRTDLAFVIPLQHGASIATVTCVTQVS